MAIEEQRGEGIEAGDSGAPVSSDVGGDHRSRAAERIQELIEQNKRDREAHREEMARFMEVFKTQQQPAKPEEKFDPMSIEDLDERREAQLAMTQGQIAELKRELARRDAEQAHAQAVQRAMHRLDFGEGQDLEDAQEAIGHYARNHAPGESRAYAERLAARWKRENNEGEKKTETKPNAEQEWAKQKLADRKATAPVSRGTASASLPPKPKEPTTRPHWRDQFKEAGGSLRADLQAAHEADQE